MTWKRHAMALIYAVMMILGHTVIVLFASTTQYFYHIAVSTLLLALGLIHYYAYATNMELEEIDIAVGLYRDMTLTFIVLNTAFYIILHMSHADTYSYILFPTMEIGVLAYLAYDLTRE